MHTSGSWRGTAVLVAVLAAAGPAGGADCIACDADSDVIRATYSAADWATLTRGDVVTSTVPQPRAADSVHSVIQASAIIPRAPELVWSVVTDFDCRPEFMPGVKEARLVRTEGDRVWVTERLRVWGVGINYNFVGTLDPRRGRFSWELDKSMQNDLAASVGAWQLLPLDEGQRTLVQYRAHVDTGRPVPEFVEAFLTRRSLPDVVDSVRAEVQHRYPTIQSEVRPHRRR